MKVMQWGQLQESAFPHFAPRQPTLSHLPVHRLPFVQRDMEVFAARWCPTPGLHVMAMLCGAAQSSDAALPKAEQGWPEGSFLPRAQSENEYCQMGESHAWVFWGRRVALSYGQGSMGC